VEEEDKPGRSCRDSVVTLGSVISRVGSTVTLPAAEDEDDEEDQNLQATRRGSRVSKVSKSESKGEYSITNLDLFNQDPVPVHKVSSTLPSSGNTTAYADLVRSSPRVKSHGAAVPSLSTDRKAALLRATRGAPQAVTSTLEPYSLLPLNLTSTTDASAMAQTQSLRPPGSTPTYKVGTPRFGRRQC